MTEYYPLDIIHGLLEAEPKITSLLSTYQEFPAVVQDVAPEDIQMPYIVLRLESDPIEENKVLARALISIDVYVNNSRQTCRQIAGEIKRLLNEKNYNTFSEDVEAGAISTFVKGRYEPIQPDPTIKSHQTKVILRYTQDDLFE